MMLLPDLNDILNNIVIPDPNIVVRIGFDADVPWLQITHRQIGDEANGRKWRISVHSTESEVVQTVFMAYRAWQEHETREGFHYKGVPIFGPHFDVNALVELAQAGRWDVRH